MTKENRESREYLQRQITVTIKDEEPMRILITQHDMGNPPKMISVPIHQLDWLVDELKLAKNEVFDQ